MARKCKTDTDRQRVPGTDIRPTNPGRGGQHSGGAHRRRRGCGGDVSAPAGAGVGPAAGTWRLLVGWNPLAYGLACRSEHAAAARQRI